MTTETVITEAEKLVTEAQEILERVAEHTIEVGKKTWRTIEHDLADVTQLRVAVHRLGLFEQHLNTIAADEPVRQEREAALGDDEPEGDLGDLTRAELDAKAQELGVEDPDKLPNKQAVIDAISALDEDQAGGEDDDEQEDDFEAEG